MNQAITRTQDTTLNTAVTPSQLLTLAIESKADPDRLDKLMDLQIKWEATQAKKAYLSAMAIFRSKCPAMEKTKQVDYTSSKGRTLYYYTGLSEAVEALKGLMSECGLSHSWRTTQDERGISVRCVVTHVEGHSEETSLTAPPDNTGNKNGIQAIASTVSYLERYTLFALLGLASQDMDNDANGNGNGKEAPKPENDVTKIISDAFETFCQDHSGDVGKGFVFDAEKFKNALRVLYLKTKDSKEKPPVFNTKIVENLVGSIEPFDILSEIK